MTRFLITGCNRGIGLEFVRQLAGRGDTIYATCRNPDDAAELTSLAEKSAKHVHVLQMDVADDNTINEARKAVGEMTDSLDVVINNAGIYPSRRSRMQATTREEMLDVFNVNTVSPVIVTKYFIDLLKKGERPRLVNITSQMGSISRRRHVANYPYSVSKTALNMVSRLMAFELQQEGIAAVLISPGWVRTDMGGSSAPVSVEESVRGMLHIIDNATVMSAGRYLQWDGEELAW